MDDSSDSSEDPIPKRQINNSRRNYRIQNRSQENQLLSQTPRKNQPKFVQSSQNNGQSTQNIEGGSKLTSALKPSTRSAIKIQKSRDNLQDEPEHGETRGEKQYTFYLDLQFSGLTQLPKSTITISCEDLVSDALVKALDRFNFLLKPQGVQLSLNINFYAPRLCKRNGKPKLDMPSLDFKQKMIETRVEAVSIQIKNVSSAVISEKNIRQSSDKKKDEESQFIGGTVNNGSVPDLTQKTQREQNTELQSGRIMTNMNLQRKEEQIRQEEPPSKKGMCFSSVC